MTHPFSTPVRASVHVVPEVTTIDGRTLPGPTLPCFSLLDLPTDVLQQLEAQLRPPPTPRRASVANTQPISDPIGVSKSSTASIGLEAIDHRRGQGAVAQSQHGNTFGTISGVFPGGTSGAGKSNDLQGFVSSGRTVTHNAGHFAVDRGVGNLYLGMVYAGISLTLDAGDPVNPRIDLVVLRVRDPGLSGDGIVDANFESAKLVVLKGTPAASPLKPTGQLTSGDLPLTYFTVGFGANANTIIATEDARLFVVARGGITPFAPADTRPGAYEGDYADDPDTDTLMRWNGASWEPIASSAPWREMTPKLYSSGGGECLLGTGGVSRGRYQLLGRILRFRYFFRAGTGCNLGSGYITTRLPAGYKSVVDNMDGQHIRCQLNTRSIGFGPQSIWIGDCYIDDDDTVLQPFFPNSRDNCTLNAYRVAATAGQPGASIPFVGPTAYADPIGALTIDGEVEVAI